VNGRLRAQHLEAVVKLDRVLIDPVLEAHPFWTSAQVAHHLAVKAAIQPFAQKTHDLLAAQIEHPLEDQAREQPVQDLLIVKEHVTGKLGLRSRPIIRESMQGLRDLLVQGMIAAPEFLTQSHPVGAQLRVGQALSRGKVFHPGKTVVGLAVAQSLLTLTLSRRTIFCASSSLDRALLVKYVMKPFYSRNRVLPVQSFTTDN
jgi:hypothetical protein